MVEQRSIVHPPRPATLRYLSRYKDLLLVGAPTDDTAAGTNAGSAYTFTRTAGVWGSHQIVTPPDAAANDYFGNSVGIIGNIGIGFGRYIVVSAYLDDDLGTDSGSATLFRETLETGGGGGGGGFYWNNVRKFVAADGQAGDNFGAALAVGGNVIVFGARLEDAAGTNAGAAYIFRNTSIVGSPNWGTGFKVIGSSISANERFGASVATDGTTVVVGAPLDDNAGSINAGAAFIFRRIGSDWIEQQMLEASDRAPENQFGYAVAVSGSTLLVGAPLDDNEEGKDSGAAYFFEYAFTAPTIATQPASGPACCGGKAFSVVATGGGPYTYQWSRNGSVIVNGPNVSGATTATLILTSLTSADEGSSYTCMVTSPCGNVTSSAALLTVCPDDTNCLTLAYSIIGNASDAPPTRPPATGPSATSTASGYEVTNAQYAAFLNAVAQAIPPGFANMNMGTMPRGGITRSGINGSYTYGARQHGQQARELHELVRRRPLLQLDDQRPACRRRWHGEWRIYLHGRELDQWHHTRSLETQPGLHPDRRRVVQGRVLPARSAGWRYRQLLAVRHDEQQPADSRNSHGHRRHRQPRRAGRELQRRYQLERSDRQRNNGRLDGKLHLLRRIRHERQCLGMERDSDQ